MSAGSTKHGLGVIGTAGRGDRADRAAGRAVGWLRLLPGSWPTSGPSRTRHQPQLRAIRTATHPRFQGQALSTLDSKARAREQRERLAERNMQAVNDMVAKHEAELAADAR